jgi:hypothetical protein
LLEPDEILKYFTGQIETSECINTSERLQIKPEEYLAKRSIANLTAGKPSGQMSEEKFASLKVLKTEDRERLPEIIREIDFEANLEENRRNLDGLRMKERILESKNSRMRKNRVFLVVTEVFQALRRAAREGHSGAEHQGREVKPDYPRRDPLSLPAGRSQANHHGSQRPAERKPVPAKREELFGGREVSGSLTKVHPAIGSEVSGDERGGVQVRDQRPGGGIRDLRRHGFHQLAEETVRRGVDFRDRVVAIFLNDNPYQFKTAEKLYGESNIAKLMTKSSPGS